MRQNFSLPGFDAEWYERTYGDVALSGLSPAEHYRRIGARLGRPPRPDSSESVCADHAVILHVFHLDTLPELVEAVRNFPPWTDLYVSYPRGAPDFFFKLLQQSFPQAEFIAVENLGQDIGAFLQVLRRIDPNRYAFFCKLHSKKGDKYPSIWRQALLKGVAGTSERVAAFAELFRSDPDLLIGGPRELFLDGQDYLLNNSSEVDRMLADLGLPDLTRAGSWRFFAGSIFWLRSNIAFQLAHNASLNRFLPPQAQRDGQTEHAIERLFGLLPCIAEGNVALASCVSGDEDPEVQPARPSARGRGPKQMREILLDLHNKRILAENRALLEGERPGLGFSQPFLTLNTARCRDYCVVTPTGDRFAAFARCAAMVAAQTIQPREWLVIDDGLIPMADVMPLPKGVHYIRRPPAADDPPHTLARNMLVALDNISAERVVIMEDDDWYSPLYAEYMTPLLDHHELVGINQIRYYHLTGRAWKNGHPPSHTAFAQTAFRLGPAWDQLAAICRMGLPEVNEKGVVDRYWWQTFTGSKLLVQGDPGLHVGFKGGFGGTSERRGLAPGHELNEIDYISDPYVDRLAQLIGCDLPNYERWTRPSRKPYVVYTALQRNQNCPELPTKIQQADFFAFTNQPENVSQPWEALPFGMIGGTSYEGENFAMAFPHLIFPDYECSLWVPPTYDRTSKPILRRHSDFKVDRSTAFKVIPRSDLSF